MTKENDFFQLLFAENESLIQKDNDKSSSEYEIKIKW